MPEINKIFMDMALEIGFSRLGKTSPNPPVGAVIVRNGEIISYGGTAPSGCDHAEVCAIKNANKDISGSEMYVTLEPCCPHEKKTPPCTDAIKAAGITRVYVPVLDPNPAVAGKGIEMLRKDGIDVVIMSDMSEKAYDLIRHFKKYILNKTPYVIHKSAITIDGKTATRTGDSKWISSEYSRYISHRLRSVVDAIIIGKNTLEKDDPALNVRTELFPQEVKEYFNISNFAINGKQSFFLEMLLKSAKIDSSAGPLRVVVGMPEKIDFTKKVFNDGNYLIFANESRKNSILEDIKKLDITELVPSKNIIFMKDQSKIEQIKFILNELYKLGKTMVMLEGGGTVAGSFFEANEIDQFMYFIAPRIIGAGKDIIINEGRQTIKESQLLHDISTVMINDDLLYNAYSEPALGIRKGTECLQD